MKGSSQTQGVPILEIKDLSVGVPKEKGKRQKILVNNLHLSVNEGEMVGLIGESGSGKSLTASAVMGLLPRSVKVVGGRILFRNQNINQLDEQKRRRLNGKEMSMVFQDHHHSFTPHRVIGKQMIEMIHAHTSKGKKEAKEWVLSSLEAVNLPAIRVFNSFPFQLSGGQRQRAAIAMAMLLRPALFIADEPTTALDAITQQQILELLKKLQRETNCAVLFISHDVTQVMKRADRIYVMYGGQVMEMGTAKNIEEHASHPYTQLLLQSKPTLRQLPTRLITIPGEPGLVAERGCPFSLRCPYATKECTEKQELRSISHQHKVACIHQEQKERISV